MNNSGSRPTAEPPGAMMFGLLPARDDARQRLYLVRFFIALGSYALWAALCLLLLETSSSTLDLPSWWKVAGGVLATNLFFFAILRSGLNQQLDDPSITVGQILVAMTWLLVPLYAVVDARGLLLIGDVMIMLFGVFSLRRSQLIGVGAYALGGYLAIVLSDHLFFPERFVLVDEVMRIAMLAGMMGWCVVFGGYLSNLRQTLHVRNVELQSAVDEIRTLASHDDLTHAFNRRYIMDALKQEKARVDRGGGSFSVVILDLDHFKSINDRYGHLAGDRVLISFVERARGALRGMDLFDNLDRSRSFGRYGGEEFIVLLPGTPLAGARRCAERIREVTGDALFEEVFSVTLSAGVAEYCRAEPIESVLRRADSALYEAKDQGRDRVVVAPHGNQDVDDETDLTAHDNVIVGPFGRQNPKAPT